MSLPEIKEIAIFQGIIPFLLGFAFVKIGLNVTDLPMITVLIVAFSLTISISVVTHAVYKHYDTKETDTTDEIM